MKIITKEYKFWLSLIDYQPIIPMAFFKSIYQEFLNEQIFPELDLPLRNISKYLAKMLSSLLWTFSSRPIKNLSDFHNKINNLNKSLAGLDMKSLYINIHVKNISNIFGLVSLFNGISTFVGYLMSKSSF